MKYCNEDPQAVIAMELERTGYYGDCDDYEDLEHCPVCGAAQPEYFLLDEYEECVGCCECLHRVYELF